MATPSGDEGDRPHEPPVFTWPPVNPDPDAARANATLVDVESAKQLRSRFRSVLGRSSSVGVDLLDACEDYWLDLTHPTLARRAALAPWFPDLPGAYCPRCGTTAGPLGADSLGCPACQGSRPPFERLIRLGAYEGLLRDLIHEVKFDARRTLGHHLGTLLGMAIGHELSMLSRHRAAQADPAPVIVPMPTTFRRRMSRGIDHALVIARAVRRQTGGTIWRPIRKRHRPSQVEVSPSQRASNMARAFFPRAGNLAAALSGRLVIVVDDVTTTGATLRGACRAIQAGVRRGSEGENRLGTRPRIWAAVIGVTPAADDGSGGRSTGVRPDETEE